MLIDLQRNSAHKSESQSSKFDMFKSLAAAKHVNLTAAKELDSHFSDFGQNLSYYYVSNGKVSSYQLLNYFLDKFNEPATIHITTWGMTENAIRQLAARKASGQIAELYFVFSQQTKVNKANEYQLAVSIATAHKIIPCHAKIYLIKTPSHQVSIITSANLNRNNKLEAGTITSDLAIYQGYQSFLNQLLCS
jgi:hypothetical protein